MSTITVWKKALRCTDAVRNTWEFVIIEATCDEDKLLKFPLQGGKCRVPEVTVINITTFLSVPGLNLSTTEMSYYAKRVMWDNWLATKEYRTGEVVSWYNHWTTWRVGKTVKADAWYPDCNGIQCHHGIHVFLTREEAENYDL
jgi:hypothetical protein